MLKLSLYGFEFYVIKEQYVIFYLNLKLPHGSIFTEKEAVRTVCFWIVEQDTRMFKNIDSDYHGPTAQQFKEAYESLNRVSE